MKKNIVLFGTGEFGKKALDFYFKNDEINIIACCDNDKKKHNTYFFGIKIISVEELLNTKYDEIVIASSFDNEISNQLIDLGVSSEYLYIYTTNQKNIQLGDGEKLLMAEDLMFEIATTFNQNKIEYHIDHGTLLGIIRDDKILSWDIDIDFAIPACERIRTLEVLNKSLKIYTSKYCTNNNWECSIDKQFITLGDVKKQLPMVIKVFNNIKDSNSDTFSLDIELKHEYENKVYWVLGSRRLSCKKNICFPSSMIIFKGKQLKVPNNTSEYLESLYGNWRKIIKDWTYNQYANIDN